MGRKIGELSVIRQANTIKITAYLLADIFIHQTFSLSVPPPNFPTIWYVFMCVKYVYAYASLNVTYLH